MPTSIRHIPERAARRVPTISRAVTAAFAAASLVLPAAASAATSTNFGLTQESAGASGINSSSANHSVSSHAGDSAGGRSASTNYVLDHGIFWTLQPSPTPPPGGGSGGGSSDGGGSTPPAEPPPATSSPPAEPAAPPAENPPAPEPGKNPPANDGEKSLPADGAASSTAAAPEPAGGGGFDAGSAPPYFGSVGTSGNGSSAQPHASSTAADAVREALVSFSENVYVSVLQPVGNAVRSAAQVTQRAARAVIERTPIPQAAVEKTAGVSASVLVPAQIVVQQSATVLQILSGGIGGSDAWLMVLKVWYGAGVFLGLRRRHRREGTVYDSETKQPIDPAIVELYEEASGKLIGSSITDIAGRFGFVVGPGRYRIFAKKTHYTFPSRAVAGPADEIFQNLYHGEVVTVIAESAVIAPNVPMDRTAFDWNQQAKDSVTRFRPRLELVLSRCFGTVFWLGFALTLLVALGKTSALYYGFLALYVIVAALRLSNVGRRLWGRVYDAETRALAPGLLLELSGLGTGIVFSKARSGRGGKFFLRAPKGRYRLVIKRTDAADAEILKDSEVEVSDSGMLVADIGV